MSNLTAQQIYEKQKYQKVGTFFGNDECPMKGRMCQCGSKEKCFHNAKQNNKVQPKP